MQRDVFVEFLLRRSLAEDKIRVNCAIEVISLTLTFQEQFPPCCLIQPYLSNSNANPSIVSLMFARLITCHEVNRLPPDMKNAVCNAPRRVLLLLPPHNCLLFCFICLLFLFSQVICNTTQHHEMRTGSQEFVILETIYLLSIKLLHSVYKQTCIIIIFNCNNRTWILTGSFITEIERAKNQKEIVLLWEVTLRLWDGRAAGRGKVGAEMRGSYLNVLMNFVHVKIWSVFASKFTVNIPAGIIVHFKIPFI